ncbi:MAG TPA: glutamine--fructose-6-phosphate transaminase (isomerizing) [Patescibacteria group bacterium]|nr:glutamine--fructose-6-phosphate transaminase (isomerizing) [Patescibacteria group bacterium]
MCGIFGYVGNKTNAAAMIFEGLKTLEYRGYDSWGIAVRVGNTLKIEKHVGKIGDKKLHLPASSLGIGHTRWATHGGVTVANAHPHLDCTGKIAVLHNGIIENYEILKEELVRKGHVFKSETDTEIVPHMLEEYMEDGMSFSKSMEKTFNLLKGLSAILAINNKDQEIVAAKNGSPLIIGVGTNEYFIASDSAGILSYTKKVIFMRDYEMVILNTKLLLKNLHSGKTIKPIVETVSWNPESASKGIYRHFMIKEILEQPKIVRNIAKTYEGQIKALGQIVEKARRTFFIGAGTASFACMVGVYLFSRIAKKHANTAVASEFNYLEDFLTKDSLVIPLTQSGETIDIVEPLARVKEKGATIAAITNVLGSTIYRMADFKMLLGAGPEKAVASTKAYTAKLAILWLLSHALIGEFDKAKEELLVCAEEIERLIKKTNLEKVKKLAKKIVTQEHMYIIGRGISSATAFEGALKVKEVSYIHAEGLAGGELKHGTIALINKGVPCVVLAPQDETYDAIMSNAMEVKARGGYIIGISSKNSPIFDAWIDVHETAFPAITQVIVMQLLGYYLAVLRKLDPDKPRNLAKSVVVK